MASHLNATEFQIGSTQIITGISTSVTGTNSSLSTSKAIKDFIDYAVRPVSLTVSGNWANTQIISSPVDTTGLSFTVTYGSGKTASVTPNVSPSIWSSTVGTQTATFSHTERGVTVSASKSASVEFNWRTVPLTLQAREAGNIRITKNGDPGIIYYSKNGGAQAELASNTDISVVTGDKVSFYRTLSGDLGSGNNFYIRCTNNCYVYGNVMSLYNKDNFTNLTTIEYNYAFINLFFSNQYIDINESVGKLILPATTLTDYCYFGMFRGCTSLITAPELPATTLANNCYRYMFSGCISLITAPYILPATTLADSCYYRMFEDCTSLTTVPSNMLPATTLASQCYASMFEDCTSLTTAPVLSATTLAIECCSNMFRNCTSLTTVPSNMLPATTLASQCYASMFEDCTSLTTAPVLSATTLTDYCYFSMFSGCTSLTTITCLATDISAFTCTRNWVSGVASSGTFTTPSSTSWTTGDSGIPEGWTRVNA